MSDSLSHFIIEGTLGLLIAFSVLTWALIIAKGLQVARSRGKDARFRAAVGASQRLPSSEAVSQFDGPTARVAAAFASLWEQVSAAPKLPQLQVVRDVLELSLKKQIQRERHSAEAGLAVLASIGTTSPFVGLFGTVWGIYHALISISIAGQASLDKVAGPIGEALIMTAMGLAVAVPAVLGFNGLLRGNKALMERANYFAHDVQAALLSGSRVPGK